jgi:putative ABC transport system ATP-binding protein
MVTLLTVRDASVEVAGRTLWRDLSIELSAGDRLVVDGPSGSGKTMLLRAIAGLDEFTTGRCEFRGRAPQDWPMPSYRAQVMYVPQRAALAPGTVAQVLREPFGLAVHQDKEFKPSAAQALLTALGRPAELLQSPTGNLSGGELQSVLLTRALLLEPTILLLDEVTAALDPELAGLAERMLIEWSTEGERALLWVGHDPASQGRVGTKVLAIPGSETAPEVGGEPQ